MVSLRESYQTYVQECYCNSLPRIFGIIYYIVLGLMSFNTALPSSWLLVCLAGIVLRQNR